MHFFRRCLSSLIEFPPSTSRSRFVRSATSALSRWMTSASDRTSLICTLLMMVMALLAKRRVWEVSSAWGVEGFTVAITAVRALPPRLGCRILVSLELRNGTCSSLRPSASLLMTFPSMSRLVLMWALSPARTPVFSVFSSRSLPAKSTKFRVETLRGALGRLFSIVMRKMVCEREDESFILVAAVCRRDMPRSSSTLTRPTLSTTSSWRPETLTPCTGSSLICRRWALSPWWSRCAWFGAPRSRISSLYISSTPTRRM
mmetsp:Transcript_13929/g.39443  ORF Transcript_13929/g.39443 Transcript_13929/m.39443 type:complete len:259 (-) Transcript_13929:580-1356(-)